MEEKIIEEIVKLNKEIKEIIKQHSDSAEKIILDRDFVFDQAKNNFSEKLVKDALVNGLHLEDKHLYPDDPNKKHKGKNYYCIYKKKENLFLVNYILISYVKKMEILTLFHISPLRAGSKEQRRYKEIMTRLKNSSIKNAQSFKSF